MTKAWIASIALAATLALTPAAIAQPDAARPAPTQTGPTQTEPAPPPAPPASPPAPQAPTTPETAAPAATADPNCRTRKEAGQACACLSDPDRVGEAQAAPDGGRNMCVMPAR